MRAWLADHDVGRRCGPTLAYIGTIWLVALAVASALRWAAVPIPVIAGVFFFLGTFGLLPIARENFREPPFRTPAYLLFRPLLDRNFALGYAGFCLAVGLAAGVVGALVL